MQQRFTYDQSSFNAQTTWYIALDYINKTSGDWSSPAKTWLHSEEETVVHNAGAQDSWIVFNVNKTGRYINIFPREFSAINLITKSKLFC